MAWNAWVSRYCDLGSLCPQCEMRQGDDHRSTCSTRRLSAPSSFQEVKGQTPAAPAFSTLAFLES